MTLVMMYANVKKVAPYYYPDWTFMNLIGSALYDWQFALVSAVLMWIYLRRHFTSTEYGPVLISITILLVVATEIFYAITKALGVW